MDLGSLIEILTEDERATELVLAAAVSNAQVITGKMLIDLQGSTRHFTHNALATHKVPTDI